MDFINSYSQTELGEIEGKDRRKISKENGLYFPIKIRTAQSRATVRGYSVRYIRKEDIQKYMKKQKNSGNDKKNFYKGIRINDKNL